jgi:hypothetical protein
LMYLHIISLSTSSLISLAMYYTAQDFDYYSS